MQRWLSKPLNMSKQLFNSGEIAISAHYHALLGARFVFSVPPALTRGLYGHILHVESSYVSLVGLILLLHTHK